MGKLVVVNEDETKMKGEARLSFRKLGHLLKRWIKDFDRCFPTRGLDSLRRWLWSFAWFHNLIMDGYF